MLHLLCLFLISAIVLEKVINREIMLLQIYKQIIGYIFKLPICIYSRNSNKAEFGDYSRVKKTLYIMNT